MSQKDEAARIEAEVQKRVEKIVAAQQKQFAKMLEATMKNSLKGVDKANAGLRKERKSVEKELDAVQKLRAKAEREGDKMAQEYYEGRQVQFREAAQTELLRDLVCMHLEVGKSVRDIAIWLNVPKKFVENIQQLLKRVAEHSPNRPKRVQVEGSPKLRYETLGRGGNIYYESIDAQFDMWWEFAGGGAFIIVDIPTKEQWEVRTNIPLDQREKVLTFIGEQIVLDHMSYGGYFIIGENVLTFFSAEK